MKKPIQFTIPSHKQSIKIAFMLTTFIITTNCDSDLDLNISQNMAYIPMFKCNITCQQCQTQLDTKCLMCPNYFSQDQNSCIKNNDQQIEYHQYFFETNLRTKQLPFSFYVNGKQLSYDNIFTICVLSSLNYKFDTIGILNFSDNFSFLESYSYQSTSIALNFRLFFSNATILRVSVNNLEEYQIELKKGGSSSWVPSNIAYYNPAFDSNGVKLNLGIINDSISKVMQNFATIHTDMLTLNNKNAQITIKVDSGNWAIMELNVVSILCTSCVSDSIKKFAAVLGIIIAISSGVIVILLLMLHLYSKIKQANYRKALKKEFQETQRKTIGMRRKPK